MRTLLQSLRQRARGLLSERSSAVAALILVTPCIALALTLAGILRGLVGRPLPFENATQLIKINSFSTVTNTTRDTLSRAEREVVQAAFGEPSTATYLPSLDYLTLRDDQSHTLSVLRVGQSFFSTLRVPLLAGRTLGSGDYAISPPAIVLSTGAWRRYFNGDTAVVGTVVNFAEGQFLVVGILDDGFRVPDPASRLNRPDVVALLPRSLVASEAYELPMVARSPSSTAESEDVLKRLAEGSLRSIVLRPTPLATAILERGQAQLDGIRLLIGLVLCAAVVVIASVFLEVTNRRARSIAIRRLLGATPFQISVGFLIEVFWLAGVSGVAAAVLSVFAIPVVLHWLPPDLGGLYIGAPWSEIGLIAAGTVLLLTVLGAAPAMWIHSRQPPLSPGPLLAHGTESRASTIYIFLIAVQTATCTATIIIAAGLLYGFNAVAGDLGFSPAGAVSVGTRFPRQWFPDRTQTWQTFGAVLDAVRALEPSSNVGASVFFPFGRNVPAGRVVDPSGRVPDAEVWYATSGYFAAMGSAFVEGRDLTGFEERTQQPVALINRAYSSILSTRTGRSAIGQVVPMKMGEDRIDSTIIGVVEDIRVNGLARRVPQAFVPFKPSQFRGAMIIARLNRGDASTQSRDAIDAIERVDDRIPVVVTELDEVVDRALSRPRFQLIMFGVSAGIASLVAIAGLISMMGRMAAKLAPEMAIRLALGAPQWRLLWLLVSPAAIGVATGVMGGVGVWWWMRATVATGAALGIPASGRTAVAWTLSVVAVAAGLFLVASWSRVTKVQPAEVLRYSR